MKKKAKKVLSLVLALSMVLGLLCFNASAASSYTFNSKTFKSSGYGDGFGVDTNKVENRYLSIANAYTSSFASLGEIQSSADGLNSYFKGTRWTDEDSDDTIYWYAADYKFVASSLTVGDGDTVTLTGDLEIPITVKDGGTLIVKAYQSKTITGEAGSTVYVGNNNYTLADFNVKVKGTFANLRTETNSNSTTDASVTLDGNTVINGTSYGEASGRCYVSDTNGYDLTIEKGNVAVLGKSRSYTCSESPHTHTHYDQSGLTVKGGTVYANGVFASVNLAAGELHIGDNDTAISNNIVTGDGAGTGILHWGEKMYLSNGESDNSTTAIAATATKFTHAQVTGTFSYIMTVAHGDNDPADMCGDLWIRCGENNVFSGIGSWNLTVGKVDATSEINDTAIVHLFSGNYKDDTNNAGNNYYSHEYASIQKLTLDQGSTADIRGVVTNVHSNEENTADNNRETYNGHYDNSTPHSFVINDKVEGKGGTLIISEATHTDSIYKNVGDKYSTVTDVRNVAIPTITGTFAKVTGTTINGGSTIYGDENTTIVTNSNTNLSGIYNTVIVRNAANNVTVSGNAEKIIVESGTVTMTDGSAKEVVVKNGGTFNMTAGKIENLAVAANEYKAVTVEAGGKFNMNGGAINLQPSAEYCNSTKLTAVENAGTANLKKGTITIHDGTGNRAICNHKDVVIGDNTTSGNASTADKLTINMLRGTAIRNDVQEANTTVYDVAITIDQNDLTAGSIGMDAAFGEIVINSGIANTVPGYTPVVTVSVDVEGDKGIALNIGANTAWQVAGSYKSATFTAVNPAIIYSATSAVDGVMPLSGGIFQSKIEDANDIRFENATTHVAGNILDLIPAKNFVVFSDATHNNDDWGSETYYEDDKTIIVDMEWALRHAATQSNKTFKMNDVDADSAVSTIYLDEYLFWGAVKDEDLDVSGSLTLDLNGKTLTKGTYFGNVDFENIGLSPASVTADTQLIEVSGTLTINDTTGGTIDAVALPDAIKVNSSHSLTVNGGTIIGGTNGINTAGTTTVKGGNVNANNEHVAINVTGGTTTVDANTTHDIGAVTVSNGAFKLKSTTTGVTSTIWKLTQTGGIVTIGPDAAPAAAAPDAVVEAASTISGGTLTQNAGTFQGGLTQSNASSTVYLNAGSILGNVGYVRADSVTGNQNNVKKGFVFSKISTAVPNEYLDDLLDDTNSQQLTFKDSNNVEMGGFFIRNHSALSASTDVEDEQMAVVGTLADPGDDLAANFTVVDRSFHEIHVNKDANVTVSDGITTDSDTVLRGGTLFVNNNKPAKLDITAADNYRIKYVEKNACQTDNPDHVARTAANDIGAAANQKNYTADYTTPITADQDLYVASAAERVITVNVTHSAYGTVEYQYLNSANGDADYTGEGKHTVTGSKVYVADGNSVKFTMTAADGNHLHSFSGGTLTSGGPHNGTAAATYKMSNVTAGGTLAIDFCNRTTSAILNNSSYTLYLNGTAAEKTVDLDARVNADNPCYSINDDGAHDNPDWVSSDTAVATVDANGVVTAVATGTATITYYGQLNTTPTATPVTPTCTITVTNHVYGGGGGGGAVAPATYTITCETGVKADVKSSAEGKTITLTVSDGYENVVVKDAKGNEIKVTNNTFEMPASDVTVSVSKKGVATTYDKCDKGEACVLKAFNDLDAWRWYHDGIHYCLDNGVMNGLGNGEFASTASTTRGMIFTILARLDGVTITSTGNEWYTDGQAWSVKAGVSDGTDPTGNITREQLAAMLYRYAKLKGYDVSVGEDTNILSYDDAFSVSEYAVGAMQWAVGAGIIKGDNNNLKPTTGATRVEVATMLMRFCETVVK